MMVLRGYREHRRPEWRSVVLMAAVMPGQEGSDQGALAADRRDGREGRFNVSYSRRLTQSLAVSGVDERRRDQQVFSLRGYRRQRIASIVGVHATAACLPDPCHERSY